MFVREHCGELDAGARRLDRGDKNERGMGPGMLEGIKLTWACLGAAWLFVCAWRVQRGVPRLVLGLSQLPIHQDSPRQRQLLGHEALPRRGSRSLPARSTKKEFSGLPQTD